MADRPSVRHGLLLCIYALSLLNSGFALAGSNNEYRNRPAPDDQLNVRRTLSVANPSPIPGDPNEPIRAHRKSTVVNIADPDVVYHEPNDRVATFSPAAVRAASYKPNSPDSPAGYNNDRSWFSAASGSRAGVDSVATTTMPSSIHGRARSIDDWSMHNLVLMATVDGAIYARRRDTGEDVWSFMSDRPMIQIDYPTNSSRYPHPDGVEDQSDPNDVFHTTTTTRDSCSEHDFMWIVEPAQDGALYIMAPGPDGGLQSLGITVRQLAEEMSPYSSDSSPFIYTAEKKNTLYNLNAADGTPLRFFSASAGASYVPDSDNKCRRISGLEALEDDVAECERIPTLVLGRTEYTVAVHEQKTGRLVCTIKYMEWTPNNRDRDLQAQYSAPMDHRYIYSRYDGGIIALQYRDAQVVDSLADPNNPIYNPPKLYSQVRLLYNTKFTHSPVVQVFDIAKPTAADDGDTTHVVLSQPIAPNSYHNPKRMENGDYNAIFINRTREGSWYALSENRFPSVTDGASKAQCYLPDGSFVLPSLDPFLRPDGPNQCHHLVGVHYLSMPNHFGRFPSQLTIDPPKQVGVPLGQDGAVSGRDESRPLEALSRKLSERFPSLPSEAGLWIVLVLFTAFFVAMTASGKHMLAFVSSLSRGQDLKAVDKVEPVVAVAVAEGDLALRPDDPVEEPVETEPKKASVKTVRFAAESSSSTTEDSSDRPPLSDPVDPPSPEEDDGETDVLKEKDVNVETKKKKAHRGQRGGRRRKKKSPSVDIENAPTGVDPVDAAVLTPVPTPTNGDGDEAYSLNNLVISKSNVLGHGSGGTVVFEGKFEGRRVAVKRLLLESFRLASQEVDLLQQSDDHPNVIRYFCHQKDSDFLYIALELCQASIWDLFQGSSTSISGGGGSGLLPAGELEAVSTLLRVNVVNGLHQLASGLNHLHSLRIVHRDIKPQNILVAYPKKNTAPSSLRLVISDFGLCRSLPDDASTLVGTTGNAGTIGWKAPELIVQPRSGEGRSSASGSYSHLSPPEDGGSSSDTPLTGVKRSVDIFSLGCVFFYVLTNGAHPFDNGDDEAWHSLREVNIKKNNRNFDRLRGLGGDSDEPLHLIEWMLRPVPEERPTAAQVMNHPFFWSPAKRLAFLCDVSDHWERECRDPPSVALVELERHAADVIGVAASSSSSSSVANTSSDDSITTANFLDRLHRSFVDTLGKQRKYNGDRILDLLRALRNKRNHFAEMPDEVKARVGPLPDGYLYYWTIRFPRLLMCCWKTVIDVGVDSQPPFRAYIHGGLD